MSERANQKWSAFLRRVAASMVASGAAAISVAHAWPSDKPVVVEPAALPKLAQQPGQAMLLYGAADGRTLLYVEQSQGKQLAIFDVTYPSHIKSAGVAQLDVPGPFDFVSTFGSRAEVVRFREGRSGDAVLDFNRVDAPTLNTTQRLTLPVASASLMKDGVTGSPIDRNPQFSQDYQLPAQESSYSTVLDGKQVLGQVTNRDTGTTFLLTDEGLYVIRRPRAERENERREDDWRSMYSGGGG